MRGQLASGRDRYVPGHDLGIVLFTAASPIAPASGLVLHDNDLAVVETLGGRLQISDPVVMGSAIS
jgi:hypothetical protein